MQTFRILSVFLETQTPFATHPLPAPGDTQRHGHKRSHVPRRHSDGTHSSFHASSAPPPVDPPARELDSCPHFQKSPGWDNSGLWCNQVVKQVIFRSIDRVT